MRLSVVVPVYNAEGTLSRCIDSLLQQEVEGYEVLLVDDGSTDGSFALMEAYQNGGRTSSGFSKSPTAV